MSHIIDKIKQHRSKPVKNKSGESTSNINAQSQTEGDSRLHRSQCITNTPIVAGTFTLLIATLPITTLTIAALSLSVLLSLPIVVDTHAYTTGIEISGGSSLDVTTTPSGENANIITSNVTVTSTCPNGYVVSITGPSDATLYKDGTSTSTDKITTTTGTKTSPKSILGDYLGTWGYSTSSNKVSDTFIGLSSTTTELYSKGSASADAGDSIPVYFAASIPDNLPLGTYKMINSDTTGKITYALTANESCFSYTVKFNSTSAAGGTTITGTGTMSDQTIKEGVATALTANAFTAPDGYLFDSWNTRQDGTGTKYTDGQSVTDLASAGESITLYAQWKTPTVLYDAVASMSKGKQTAADLQAAITVPTSADRTQDTSNSGVYEYDASVFGAASDASNDKAIYYYRGVLENEVGSYGSDGSAVTYPNYVVLDTDGNLKSTDTNDTCWRIVRTTGSGGVKLIYNGEWTGSTCANAQANTRAISSVFDTTANSSSKSIVGVGYTYNASYKSTTSAAQAGTLFGTNSSYSGNTTNSTIKTNIDNWYTNNTNTNNVKSYASILEPSAGYCNDRSVNTGSSWTTYSDTTSITKPYVSSGTTTVFYFGSYMRNTSTAQTPSLTCPRNVVDLYTTSSASNGNNQLTNPIALLTADELSFAGSGSSTATDGSSYNANSFLRSDLIFWLLSPYNRGTRGYASEFALDTDGTFLNGVVYNQYGVRPAISLKSGTTATSGSGTATDPWVVKAP